MPDDETFDPAEHSDDYEPCPRSRCGGVNLIGADVCSTCLEPIPN